jgi:chaperonin cofactor prefoldin
MKISKNDLRHIIKEEAHRLFQIEKLEEAKRAVDNNIRLVSEGKKKMSDEELEELWAGLKSVLGAGAQKVGQAVSGAAQKAQQVGQKVAATYRKGENDAKITSLQKQQADLTAKLKTVSDELAKLAPPAAASAAAKRGRPAKAKA